ncbi:hypothetical protein GCM10017567_76010 [Amycolatopsis bullii]|uniref:Uncharacterized protein n=2 Tax=Pseudonocardiaceae TaxID=2070 RepID=A0ABQ3KRP5_9PSEU|nr:hypothetical protein GCM10017567_76010 [Amycolatopsis bullii]
MKFGDAVLPTRSSGLSRCDSGRASSTLSTCAACGSGAPLTERLPAITDQVATNETPVAGYAHGMTTSPFEPNPETGHQEIAAADPGRGGAPGTADGFGSGETGPDVILPNDDGEDEPDA